LTKNTVSILETLSEQPLPTLPVYPALVHCMRVPGAMVHTVLALPPGLGRDCHVIGISAHDWPGLLCNPE